MIMHVKEATRKVCDVLVARLQGKSWAPPVDRLLGERGNGP